MNWVSLSDGLSFFFFAIASFWALSFSWRRGWLSFEHRQRSRAPPIGFLSLCFGFFLYYAPYALFLFLPIRVGHSITSIAEVNASLLLSSLLALLFFLSRISDGKEIWRQEKGSWGAIIFRALIYALFAIPLVGFISRLVQLIALWIWNIDFAQEQIAVQLFKAALSHPWALFLISLSVTVLSPFVEEILFRGLLQSFLRRYLGSAWALVLASCAFSLFHYAPQQGGSNGVIIVSLFTLSLWLGLIYEQKQSLFAPIFLHAFFNGMNGLGLYWMDRFSL